MSVYSRNSERRRVMPEYCSENKDYAVCYGSPDGHLESEKKVRREIANSNERRRMQSINAGFQSLKTLIPHSDGEKLSKAAILQHTADFIQTLKRERDRLESENSQLQRMLEGFNSSPPRKRWKRDTESSDEGITADYDELAIDDVRREMMTMKCQLERERQLRIELERQIYPDNIRDLTTQVQIVQMHNDKVVYVDSGRNELSHVHCTDTAMKTEEDKTMIIRDLDSQGSVASRNIATIVEAIRHLEGDRLGFDERQNEHSIPHSEESEKESSIISDQEDNVNSDCDSPLIYRPQQHIDIQYQTEVLRSPHLDHYVYRPGVIVQKS